MPAGRPKSFDDKITMTIRMRPDIRAELKKYQFGEMSEVIDKALRRYWKMPARDAGAK